VNRFLGVTVRRNGRMVNVVNKVWENGQDVLRIVDNNILSKLGNNPAIKQKFANDVLQAGPQFLEAMAKNSNLVDAWKGISDAPKVVRRNIIILNRVTELLTLGFVKSDLYLLSQSLNKLETRLIPDADLVKSAEYALEARKYTNQYANLNIETDLFKQINELASSTKFKNPQNLKDFLSPNQLLQNINNNPGNLEALNETIRLLKQGNEVILEGKGLIKGDIVDLTNKVSYQYKAAKGETKNALNNNLKSSAKQFNTEVPPTGYSKVAKVKLLDNRQPDFYHDTQSMQIRLQEYYNQNLQNPTGANLRNLDRIDIENGKGLHQFKIVNNKVIII